MNILITLPSHLIEAIKAGKKKIELRKNYPIRFYEKQDFVYVVEKGTNQIQIAFTVKYFEIVDNTIGMQALVYGMHHESIAVDYKWFREYVKETKVMVLWHIENVYTLKAQLPRKITNPQSYRYIRINDIIFDPLTPIEKAVQ